MAVNCEYYNEGMCVKISKNGLPAIYEPCHMEKISSAYQEKFVKGCKQRETIKRIEKLDLASRTQSLNML
jgi:hypothetical protein